MNTQTNSFVDMAALNVEKEEVEKLLKTLCRHYNINQDQLTPDLEAARVSIKEHAFADHMSLVDTSKFLHGNCGLFKRFHTVGIRALSDKLHLKSDLGRSVTEVFMDSLGRLVSLDILINDFAIRTDWDVKCSGAAKEAKMLWRGQVETSIGYRNKVNVVTEGTPGDLVIDEKLYHGQAGSYHWEAKLTVDGNWYKDVVDHKIAKVDIGGKMCLTLCADEIMEHDLLDEDVKLYQAKVAYTKVPQGVSCWSGALGDGAKSIFVEDKVIAVQTLPGGPPIITTGKDKSWAVRTMKMRMRKKIFDMMDL